MSSLSKKIASLSISFFICSLCYANTPHIPNFEANYLLKHNGIEIGRVELVVKKISANLYNLTSSTETSGLLAFIRDDDVIETSKFEMFEERLRPITYQYQENLGDGKKNVRLTFNWEKLKVSNASEGHRVWKLSIEKGVLDKALMQIALMQDLSITEQPLAYKIADGGRLKQYVFTPVGSEKITINETTYNTIKLARKKDDKPLITYYWCAPKLHNLPVLLKRNKTYGTFEMRLVDVTFMP